MKEGKERSGEGRMELSVLPLWRNQDLEVKLYVIVSYDGEVGSQMPDRKASRPFRER